MRAKQLVTIAVVSTLLFGGMAALGAAAPADQAPDSATDAYEENAPEDADAAPEDADAADRANGNASGDADGASNADGAGNADGVGPSGGLPEQVPDHVGEIHDRIDSFTNGSIDNLGESLSELLGDGAAAEESADDADGADDGTADEATENDDADESTDDEDADA
jgi:hypothetical protein